MSEEMYVQVYRKQMAVFRHKIYLALKEIGPMSEQNKEKHKELFTKIANEKPEYQKQALALFEIKQKEGDLRTVDLMMREIYLDYFTKSL
jgi:parvulin-like peptidyl-prolyl isomerase